MIKGADAAAAALERCSEYCDALAYLASTQLMRGEEEASRETLVALHPIGRLGEPAEVAELVTWLSSDRASFVTGAYYAIDGGYLAQ